MSDEREEGRREGRHDEKLESIERRISRLEYAAIIVVAFMASLALNIVLRGGSLMP